MNKLKPHEKLQLIKLLSKAQTDVIYVDPKSLQLRECMTIIKQHLLFEVLKQEFKELDPKGDEK